jgi:hypothetical protein
VLKLHDIAAVFGGDIGVLSRRKAYKAVNWLIYIMQPVGLRIFP